MTTNTMYSQLFLKISRVNYLERKKLSTSDDST